MTGPARTGPGQAREPERRGRRRFGVRAIVAFVAAVLFAVLAVLVRSSAGPIVRLDRRTSARLHGYALNHHSFTSVMRAVSNSGTTLVWTIVLALVTGWLLYRRLFKLAAFVVVTDAGSLLLNNLIKLAVGRARPHLSDPVAEAAGKSFPSGHSQAAIVGFAILVAVFLPALARAVRPWFIGLAAVLVLLIGFSRIALGVHYLSDVVGAYLIGGVWFIGMASAFGAWRRETGRPAPSATEGLEPEQGDRLTP
ncbi:MAG TPA: phosphatase PAP2 family protein [Jatrophihabitans sp.]|nr:phosphatase PAP2 family protein [Jatrophihabitans sp.]